MKTSSIEIKNILLDLVIFDNTIKEDTKERVKHTTYPKKHFRGATTLKTKLINGMELAICDKDKELSTLTNEDISWHSAKGFQVPEGKKLVMERQTTEEIELTDLEIDAIKYFIEQREEYPVTSSIEVFDEFEALIK